MKPAEWRFLSHGPRPGSENMALDMALLQAVVTRKSSPVLRLYGWRPSCLSLGRHQPESAADLGFCRSAGIDVVRRPTGGRAVVHHLELTYSVTGWLGSHPLPRHVQSAYRLLCAALVRALRTLGVDAELTPDAANAGMPSPASSVPCFKAPAGGEVMVEGRKLVGSAMRVHRGAILQHGSILLGWDSRLQSGCLGLPGDDTLRPFVTTLQDQLGSLPKDTVLRNAVKEAFSRELGVDLVPGVLELQEVEAATKLRPCYDVASTSHGPLPDSGEMT